MKLSAIVLTKKGEKNLGDCLNSLNLDLDEEIIIIDDGSEEATLKALQKANPRLVIFKKTLDGDFGRQRNFGLQKARGDWVFFLDADERISEKLAGSIKKALAVKDNQFRGYWIKRRDFLFGRWFKFGEPGRTRLLRLARKTAGRWQRPVHETWQVLGKTGELEGEILHFPHQTIKEFLEDINFYTDLNAKFFFKQGVKVSLYQILAFPLAKFFKDYFFYLGFLDGLAGFFQANFMSFHSFLTRAKVWCLWQKHDHI